MPDTRVQPTSGSYLLPSLEHATVSDAMHPGILSCPPDASLTEVARLMATHHVHCMAVVGISRQDPEYGMWGVLSDLDVIEAVVEDRDPTAGELASAPVIVVAPATPLREAARLMLEHSVSHVVVVEPAGERPIGILSTADVAGVLAWGEE